MQNKPNHIALILFLFISLVSWNSCSSVTERMHEFEVHGIDVSHYQKEIDWNTVAQQDVEFAFVKATEGQTYRDSIFCYNWGEMKRVGIKRGAYHFYTPSVDPMLQAENFLEAVEIEKGDLPPVLDFEQTGKKNRIELIADLQVWLNEVEQNYQIKPIIYTNQKLYNLYIKNNFDNYIVWIARYNTKAPDMPFTQSWTFWQYGNKGRIDGIEGDVDFNVFHGDTEALNNITYTPNLNSSNTWTYSGEYRL
jgi:lysozyme